jgi:hypothetical protein
MEVDLHHGPSRAASYVESDDRSDEDVVQVIILNGRKSMFYQV